MYVCMYLWLTVVKSHTLPVSGKFAELRSVTSITLCPITAPNEASHQRCLPAVVTESQMMSQPATKSVPVQSPSVAAIASSLFNSCHQHHQAQQPQTKTITSGHCKTTHATTNNQSVARPSSAGTRTVRPNQPLPPVRTSSCLSKSSTLPASMLLTDSYEEVPVHEPDLTRQPVRSALKGSKSAVASQSFHQQLERALTLQMSAGCQPFPVDPSQSCQTVANDDGDSSKTGVKLAPPKSRTT
jgi:hypothetical protein